MTIRNLKSLFNPSAIAVIGEGTGPDASDEVLVHSLIGGNPNRPVMPVNPNRRVIKGVLTYKDVGSLPLSPELAVITAPLNKVPKLIDELGALGTKGVLLLSKEPSLGNGEGTADLHQAMLNAAKPHLLRILGPDSLGLAAPKTGVHAILGQTPVLPGNIAMLSQSAAVARTIMDRAISRNVGFSHLVSVGARVDVDFGDLLDYLAQDNQARAIMVYLENVLNPRKFMSAARIAARMKPVILLRPRNYGSNPAGDAIYDAAFRRAGILRVRTIEGLLRAVENLGGLKRVYNNRLAIMGNSGSIGPLVSDDLNRGGSAGRLAQFSEETMEALETIVPKGLQRNNPVDLGDEATAKAYHDALTLLLKERNADGVLVLHTPVSAKVDLETAKATAELAAKSRRLVMTAWLGGQSTKPANRVFEEHNIAFYENPSDAVQVFKRIAEYSLNQELLMETPASIPEAFQVNSDRARQIIAAAMAEGRSKLNPLETADLLNAYTITGVETTRAETPEEATAIARTMDCPVVLKIYSPDIAHKSDVAGVSFNLDTPEEVSENAAAMLRRVARLMPEARIDGFLVQPMLNRRNDYEIAIGVRTGQKFGPVIYFGHGGTETEVINDIAFALPPLNMQLARDLMSRTRIFSMLSNTPGRAANLDALALTLIKVSQLVIDIGEITALDINPLWAGPENVIALDASIQIAAYTLAKPIDRLAITPYPKELEQEIVMPDGRALLLRPITAEDEPAMQAMVRRADPEDLRLRFFQPIRELSHAMGARLTQLDYDREMAFAMTDPGLPGKADIWGVVRINADPDLERGEYAILLDRTMMGLGLGPMLMRHIIDYARKRGIREIFGEVLRENQPMLKLNRALGFKVATDPEDPSLMLVRLKL